MTLTPCHPILRRLLTGLLLLTLTGPGCASRPIPSPEDAALWPGPPLELKAYATFLAQNSKYLDARYTKEYAPVDFIVDLDGSSTPVQHLIDPAAVSGLAARLVGRTPATPEKLAILLDYVQREYTHAPAPRYWVTVAETLTTRRGDCRSLSLLLLSLLLAADIPAHAAVSNGHMWVNAFDDSRWRILETDNDPHRQKFYARPGFYLSPLYRIYPDRSEKRKRRTDAARF